MKTIKSTNTIVGMSLGGVVCVAVLAIVLASCQNPPAAPASAADGDVLPQAQAYTGQVRGGAQMWAQNCQHCHNTRSPSSYSDEQWEVAMMHMRNQARLTADEYRGIRDFLKAGN